MVSRKHTLRLWAFIILVLVTAGVYTNERARHQKVVRVTQQMFVEEPIPKQDEQPIFVDVTSDQHPIEPELNAKPVTEIKPSVSAKPKPVVRTCPATDPDAPDLTLFPISPTLGIGRARPSELVSIPTMFSLSGGFFCLNQVARDSFQEMARAAERDGVLLIVVSAYRSAAHQGQLQANNEPDEHDHASVAAPGHSEHQLGTTIDLTSGTVSVYTFHRFAESAEYAWLVQNAADYGFVQSYRPGDEDLTGYIAEPWHWRYIGVDHAKKLADQNIPLVTYLTNLALETEDSSNGDEQ
jgi:hypothetical protein